MDGRHKELDGSMGHTLDGQVQAAKTAIAARLRYIRQHHPEGPFTLARLAERAHVSKRTLAAAESAEGTNLTIETLVKVAHSLGIARWAYFLDEQVFQQVNTELEAVRALSRHKVQALAMRGSHPTSLSADQLSHLLNGIIDAAAQARDSLGGTAAAANEEEHHPDGNHRYSR